MGEVYRARDTTLKREVAIKILRDLFSGAAGNGLPPWTVARDGQRVLIATVPTDPVTSPLTLLLNWKPLS